MSDGNQHPSDSVIDLLASIVDRHAEERDRGRTLVRTLVEAWSAESPESAFDTDVRALHRLAASRLRTPDGWSREPLLRGLRSTTARRIGCLKVLRMHGRWDEDDLTPLILERLGDDHADVRLAALETLCVRHPDRAVDGVPLLDVDGDRAARVLALSGESSVAEPLLRWSGFPARRPPPYVGFVLNPEWLGLRYDSDAASTERLLREFGYVNGDIESSTLEWLRHGVRFVGPRMTARGFEGDSLQRIRELVWALLPESLGVLGDAGLDHGDELELEFLLAAVRESDADQLTSIRDRDPFSPRDRRSLVCAHASAEYVHRTFVDEPARLAERLGVAAEFRGRFLVEAGRVALELDDRRRIEADLELRTRYTAMRRIGRWSGDDTRPVCRPIVSDADFPLAKFAVLDGPPDETLDPRLSIGANAVSRLARTLGHDDVAEMLVVSERLCANGPPLPPVGCEWQIPQVDGDRWLGWKQALRALGIPSPRRPEHGTMLEVSAPPSSTYHAAVLLPVLLADWGVLDRPQDVALHVSIEGDLGEDARYLAFPQSFLNNSRRMVRAHPRTAAG